MSCLESRFVLLAAFVDSTEVEPWVVMIVGMLAAPSSELDCSTALPPEGVLECVCILPEKALCGEEGVMHWNAVPEASLTTLMPSS